MENCISAKIYAKSISKQADPEEDKAYDADADDYDSKDIVKESNTNLSKRHDGFRHFSCHKFGQLFGNRKSTEYHII